MSDCRGPHLETHADCYTVELGAIRLQAQSFLRLSALAKALKGRYGLAQTGLLPIFGPVANAISYRFGTEFRGATRPRHFGDPIEPGTAKEALDSRPSVPSAC